MPDLCPIQQKISRNDAAARSGLGERTSMVPLIFWTGGLAAVIRHDVAALQQALRKMGGIQLLFAEEAAPQGVRREIKPKRQATMSWTHFALWRPVWRHPVTASCGGAGFSAAAAAKVMGNPFH
jgi:hypothetical protein